MPVPLRRARLGRRTLRPGVAAIAVGCLALAVSACGSSRTAASSGTSSASGGSSATTAASGASQSGAASGSGFLAEAQRITTAAEQGLVYVPDNQESQPSSSVTAYTSWKGPTTPVTVTKNKLADILYCAPGTACQAGAEDAQAILQKLGWTVHLLGGNGTPSSFVSIFNTAISQHPALIISAAIPDVLVRDQLGQAQQAGIVTVSTADVSQPTGSPQYTAYVDFRMPFMGAVDGYAAVADSSGHANAIVIEDSEFPDLVQADKAFEHVLSQCSGCSMKVVKWQITQAANPVQAQAIISAALSANSSANYIFTPYSIGISAVANAVRTAGDTGKVKILTKDGDSAGLDCVHSGACAFDAAASQEWMNYAAIDEAMRALAHQSLISPQDLGLPVHLFTQSNTPADGNAEPVFTKSIDYPSYYQKLWK